MLVSSAEHAQCIAMSHVRERMGGWGRSLKPVGRGGRFVVVAILLVALLGNQGPASLRPPDIFSQWAGLSSGFRAV